MLIESSDIDHVKLEEYFTPHNPVKAEIVNMASHEMKTSIQAILTYSELLQNKHDILREDYAKAILRNAMRLKMLSSNLDDLARIDEKRLRLKKERLDLSVLATSIAEDFKNMARCQCDKQDVKVQVQSQKHVFVNADKDRLEQVIFNLLDNALKFTDRGTILVKIKELPGENCTEISVIDTGPGIDYTIMPNIFGKFATSSHRGTGLGLYICKNIIEAHGGIIWAGNNDKGGAVITLQIPANQEYRNSTKFLNPELVS